MRAAYSLELARSSHCAVPGERYGDMVDSASTGGALATPLVVSAGCALATGIAAFSFLRRTTESLDSISVHGGATLVSTLAASAAPRPANASSSR